MKLIVSSLLFFATLQCYAQQKFITKSGQVRFEASVPSFEKIEAKNDKVTAILKADTGEIAVLALVQGFRFKIALMEEHFNESYAESDVFPKTMFTGKIVDFSQEDFQTEEYKPIKLQGNFTFHGVTKEISVPATLRFIDDTYTLSASFSILASDYKVKIPKIVRNKIAKDIAIQLQLDLNEK